jgi:hypothetical protein
MGRPERVVEELVLEHMVCEVLVVWEVGGVRLLGI